jgi:hypothetical protein
LSGLWATVIGGLDTYIEPIHNGANGLKIVIVVSTHGSNAVFGLNIGLMRLWLALVHIKGAVVLGFRDLLLAFVIVGLFFLPPLPKHHTTIIADYGPCRSEVKGMMPHICLHCCAWNYHYFEKDWQVDETLPECDL